MRHHNGSRPGPIKGLRLPANAWYVLRRENIRTLNQLTAIADRINQLDGIGPKTALTIHEENSPA